MLIIFRDLGPCLVPVLVDFVHRPNPAGVFSTVLQELVLAGPADDVQSIVRRQIEIAKVGRDQHEGFFRNVVDVALL